MKKKFKISSLILFCYLIFIAIYYELFIFHYFDSDNIPNYILDADSFTYIGLNNFYDNLSVLLALNPNTLGPVLILRIFNGSTFLIFITNITVFILSYIKITQVYKLNNIVFISLLVLNPLFIPVLTTLNKEIFGFASGIFVLVYIKNKSYLNLFISVLFALLCRWQMIFIVLFFLGFKYITKQVHFKRSVGIVILLMLISIVYPYFLSDTISSIADTATLDRQQATAGPIINGLNFLQNHYLYFLAVFPKSFFNLVGNVGRVFFVPYNLLFLGEKDLYNNIFLLGHQLITLGVIISLTISKKLFKNKDLLLFAILYVMIFSLGPLIQYRYLFPVYTVFCIMITERYFIEDRKPNTVKNIHVIIMISVCIATYNGEKHILKQLKSILPQLGKNDEIVLSDDSSTDNTINIVKNLKDNRIKILTGQKFRSPVLNFENALLNSSGDIIFLSDQDDIWHPQKVEKLCKILFKNDLVVSDCSFINDNDEIILKSYFEVAHSKSGVIKNLIKKLLFRLLYGI